MTKADIVAKISEKLGLEKGDVQATVESFMEEVKNSLETGDNVYLRGFGSFIVKTRAEKTGRNISKNTTIKIPAHNIPAFKPAKIFVESVKEKNKIKRDEYTQNILGHIKLAGTVTKSYARTLVDGFGKVSTSNYWVDNESIRVFTERELERLQGFPDGYLDFEVDGKKPSYSSIKGAIGNSMTVNVMYWIGQRINFIDNYIESQKVLKSQKK